jgi:hypothetical protein
LTMMGAAPCFASSIKRTRLITNEPKMTVVPMIPDNDLDNRFLNNPLIRNPANGSRGTREINNLIFFGILKLKVQGIRHKNQV